MDQVQEADVIRLDLPASHKYLNVVGSCLAAVLERMEGILKREIVTYNVELAVYETCTNIVDHAYADTTGRIEVAIAVYNAPRRLVIDLHDTGCAFERPGTTDRYGLFLINNLVDEVIYARQNGSNHWRLIKNL